MIHLVINGSWGRQTSEGDESGVILYEAKTNPAVISSLSKEIPIFLPDKIAGMFTQYSLLSLQYMCALPT